MEPKRILQVVNSMNRGGAEAFIMNLYRRIDKSKVQFDFLVHIDGKSAFEDEILALGGRVFHAPKYKLYNHFAYCQWLKSFFSSHPEIKVVHGHQYNTASVYLGVAKKMGRVTIAHSHNASNGTGLIAYIKTLMHNNINEVADYKLACSSDAGNWLYGQHGGYFVVPNAIDTTVFRFDSTKRQQKRNELNLNSSDFVIGNVARFYPVKNHSYIIDIFEDFTTKHPNSRLVLVGEGPLLDDIKKKVEEKNISGKVSFLGLRSDINELMMAMDVLLMPSLHEGLPVTMVEAQAACLPCVISDYVSKDATIIDELVKSCSLGDSIETWINAIESYYTHNRYDCAREIIEKGFDASDIAQKMEKLYFENTLCL